MQSHREGRVTKEIRELNLSFLRFAPMEGRNHICDLPDGMEHNSTIAKSELRLRQWWVTLWESQVFIKIGCKWKHFFTTFLLCILAGGCGGKITVVPSTEPIVPQRELARIGYAIQAGAFSDLNNAVRLTQTLQDRGVDAYYFVHKTGLYKVRFGDFPSKESASRKAKNLLASGIIDEYYIVGPEDYPKLKYRKNATIILRNEIITTAKSFIGVPYRWGGVSPEQGFDCSGLSMAVYHLNGLNLPRSSKAQWQAGAPVNRRQLSKGDLVFFATSGGREISHVGIYFGEDKFIHAPGRNKRIRFDSLSKRYFRRRYVGARTYL